MAKYFALRDASGEVSLRKACPYDQKAFQDWLVNQHNEPTSVERVLARQDEIEVARRESVSAVTVNGVPLDAYLAAQQQVPDRPVGADAVDAEIALAEPQVRSSAQPVLGWDLLLRQEDKDWRHNTGWKDNSRRRAAWQKPGHAPIDRSYK